MDENKRSLLIHYVTEFILGSIGVGIFVILLYVNQFNFSLNIEKTDQSGLRIKAGSGEKMRKKGDKGAPKELPEEDVMKMIEGRYTKYSDLLMQRARIIGDVGKQAFMGKSQEIKKIDRLIAKELKKLGVEPDAAG